MQYPTIGSILAYFKLPPYRARNQSKVGKFASVRDSAWKLPFYFAILSVTFFLVFLVYGVVRLALEPSQTKWDDFRLVEALKVSLLSSLISSLTAFSLALPIGYALSRRVIPGSGFVEVLSLVFLGLPPVGVGIAMIAFFSGTTLGSMLDSVFGIIFTFKGIVLAQTLVIFPIVVKFVKEVFDATPRDLEEVYQVFGADRFFSFVNIVIPHSARGLVGAWLVGWLRSLGEFGATVVVSGIIFGKTETLTIFMYSLLSSADVVGASRVMVILISIVVVVSLMINKLYRK